MRMSVEHERLVRMIKESITLMCKSSLNYELEMNVEGLLGITLDKKDVVLVNINESFQTELAKKPPTPEPPSPGQKRTRDDIIEIKEEGNGPSSCARKRRARRRSRDSTDGHSVEQFSLDYPSPSQHSPSKRSHTDTGFPPSGSGSIKEDSGDVDFGDMVIKQEIGDNSNTDDDFSFTGESFEGQPAFPGVGQYPGENIPPMPPGFPPASTSIEDGSQPGRGRLSEGNGSSLASDRLMMQQSFPCRFCSLLCVSLRARDGHERLHTGRAHRCELCGKIFTHNWLLQRHKRGVHRAVEQTHDLAAPGQTMSMSEQATPGQIIMPEQTSQTSSEEITGVDDLPI